MTQVNLIELPHITGTNITMIAGAAKCSRLYVWSILNDKRPAKSLKAKAILKTAKSINAAIEVRLNKLETETQEAD